MKLKNLFWFATGASISYHLVKNRKEIKTEVTESSQLVKGIQDNLAKIQTQSGYYPRPKDQSSRIGNGFPIQDPNYLVNKQQPL